LNKLIVYWVIGCIVVGPAMGARMNECPNAEVRWQDMTAAVAIWPAVLAAAFMLKPNPGARTSCEAATNGAVGNVGKP
jgi:hypothetical protein